MITLINDDQGELRKDPMECIAEETDNKEAFPGMAFEIIIIVIIIIKILNKLIKYCVNQTD